MRQQPEADGRQRSARTAPPRRRGHRQEAGRHAGERGSGQATRAYLADLRDGVDAIVVCHVSEITSK